MLIFIFFVFPSFHHIQQQIRKSHLKVLDSAVIEVKITTHHPGAAGRK
ncbi:hypothetical protein SLEP1_g23605 [Rubroshorea leprosula]|uniref:Uncharacterized protein n=1 Tax=Rubroshorea leprosula TaxID=152421 RepID=A0AAV5JJ46_9ROSI|nr:hypothetical protein SLEP1_g23605 [Rubroshorea leprosula]